MEKISLIIPVYNVAKYLGRCLDSIVNQTYRNLEIICVNDGSTDDSLDILNSYALKDERVKIINRENNGVSSSRNVALDVAKGEWIMFVDSDDWIDLNVCEAAMKIALEDSADVVMWAYVREFKNKSLPRFYFPENRIWDDDVAMLHRRMVGLVDGELSAPDSVDACGTCWGKLYRASCIQMDKPIRFVDLKTIGTSEDTLFNITLMGRVKRAEYVPEIWYHYRKCDSLTNKHNPNLPQQWETLFSKIEEQIEVQCLSFDFKKALRNRIVLGIIGLGLNELSSAKSIIGKYEGVDRLLKNEKYREAAKTFSLKELPLMWKPFIGAAKYGITSIVLIFLLIIKRIVSKNKDV